MLLSDNLLFNYIRCERRSFLEVYGDRSLQESEKDFLLKLRQETMKYSLEIISNLTPNYHQPNGDKRDILTRAQETEKLMSQGVNYIYNGVLLHEHNNITFQGKPTLLIRTEGISKFGPWHYYPLNIYLGRRPKLEYKILTTFHGYLLTFIQNILPTEGQFILRPYDCKKINLALFFPQLQTVLNELIRLLTNKKEPEVFISRQKCSLCTWLNYCKAIARKENHLSLVPGVTPNRYQYLQKLGINTVESLARDNSRKLEELIGTGTAHQIRLQAQAIVEQKPLKKTSNIAVNIPNSEVNLYFDIEAEPDRNLDYLLGVLVVNTRKNTEKFHPFLAQKPTEEEKIWQEFLALINKYPQAPIYHYSNYERETIKRLGKLYNTPKKEIEIVLSRCIDLHEQVINSVILPLENYSLKTIANWLGFYWNIPQVNGDQSVCWYDQWLKTGDFTLLEKILSYNQDDCFATYYLKEWLEKFLTKNKLIDCKEM